MPYLLQGGVTFSLSMDLVKVYTYKSHENGFPYETVIKNFEQIFPSPPNLLGGEGPGVRWVVRWVAI